MKAARDKPKNRTANPEDRAYAAELVRRYREKDPYREALPGGGPTIEFAIDGDYLAFALEHFAINGTWQTTVLQRKARTLSRNSAMRGAFRELRARHWSPDRAIAEIMRVFSVEFDVAHDAVYRRRK